MRSFAGTARGATFWIGRFALIFAGALVAIEGAQLLKGRSFEESFPGALAWSVVSAALFTASRIHRSRRGHYCALCGDAPEAGARDR